MTIPFDIKYRPQIESGEYKVFNSSGMPVRIVAWDFKSQFKEPIYALITTSDGYEYGCSYTEDGRYIGNNSNYLVIENPVPNVSMNIEEKARAYDEALERAKAAIDMAADKDLVKGVATTIFPQLRESEDEIHRKWILEYLYDGLRKADEQFKDHFKSAIDWLEKQKEPENTSASTMAPSCWEVEQKEQNPISQEDFDTAKHEALWEEQKPADEQFPPLEGLDAIKAKYYDDGFKNGFDEGVVECREQMMKEAVEGEVCGRVYDHINVRFADGICKFLEPKNISHIPADVSKYKVGDKVRVIVLPKEDEK